MTISARSGGAWRTATGVSARNGGAWRTGTRVYRHVGGLHTRVFPNQNFSGSLFSDSVAGMNPYDYLQFFNDTITGAGVSVLRRPVPGTIVYIAADVPQGFWTNMVWAGRGSLSRSSNFLFEPWDGFFTTWWFFGDTLNLSTYVLQPAATFTMT